ncbi:MAG: nitroreductase family protein [Turicibacter sp.]
MFNVDQDKCITCKQCINDCPTKDILIDNNKAHIKNEACIKCGHCIAICPTKAISTDEYKMDEVLEFNKESFTVEADNLLNFIKFRRSVRTFKDKAIEKENIEKIIEAGRFTQTATNSQDVSYTVVTNKIDQLKALAFESLNSKGEYILNNLTPETQYLKRYATLWTYFYKMHQEDPIKNDKLFFNAPAVIIVTANNEINGALASSNMNLMVDALGLGTFYSGFLKVAAENNEDILNLLEIKNNKKIVACMVIGYPNVTYKRTVPRKDADINWL